MLLRVRRTGREGGRSPAGLSQREVQGPLVSARVFTRVVPCQMATVEANRQRGISLNWKNGDAEHCRTMQLSCIYGIVAV